ncbi:hypothetical protein MJO29_000412, partial [Puccinia striiformis f. sp. tritici]
WTIYEQVAVSSVDLGNVQLAKISIFFAYLCRFVIQRLENNFPNLARVTVLHGMLMEAQGDLIGAKSFHELELSKKIYPSRGQSELTTETFSLYTVIELLVDHLDTTYANLGLLSLSPLYPPFLLALEDLILIQPENTFHILKYAETAYTVGEYE